MGGNTIPEFDVAVVGAGPAGLVAGLAAATRGLSVAVIGPIAPADARTSALMEPAIRELTRLGIWPALQDDSAPLTAIRLIDATETILKAPEVTFRASEIGLTAFGHNIPNARLTSELERAVSKVATRIPAAVVSAETATQGVTLHLSNGATIKANVIAAADGRRSLMREHAGIALDHWSYDQSAVITTFAHDRRHHGISTEFHRSAGPLTVVPCPGQTSSLVWVETSAEASRLQSLDDTSFRRVLERHLLGLLGPIRDLTPRHVFPLSGQTAKSLAKNRVVLIGEAAHVMPPIGAQGLNLSIRDAIEFAAASADGKATHGDAGATAVLGDYETRRRADITSRIWSVDLLNRSLIAPYAPVQLLRGAGLLALASVAPLRRYLMRQGVGLKETPTDQQSVDTAASPLDGLGSRPA